MKASLLSIIFEIIFLVLLSKQRSADKCLRWFSIISFFVDVIDMSFGIVPWLLFKQLFSIEIEPLKSLPPGGWIMKRFSAQLFIMLQLLIVNVF